MKPRVMSLVLFTCMVGLVISPVKVGFINSVISLLAVALGAGAAGALNMWYESDLDAIMSRTCLRPIPSGKIKKFEALYFGIILTIISISLLYYVSNLTAASLLAFTIFFYFFVYTVWLKKKTSQNIVIGGAAGALPPMIGWAISSNSITLTSFSLFLIIFIWTPSHFWALSIYKSDDYKKAGIPMLPVTNGINFTKKNILAYSIFMLPAVIMPFILKFTGLIFFLPALFFTFYYIFLCFRLFLSRTNKENLLYSRRIFIFSIFYLFSLFVLILIDNLYSMYNG